MRRDTTIQTRKEIKMGPPSQVLGSEHCRRNPTHSSNSSRACVGHDNTDQSNTNPQRSILSVDPEDGIICRLGAARPLHDLPPRPRRTTGTWWAPLARGLHYKTISQHTHTHKSSPRPYLPGNCRLECGIFSRLCSSPCSKGPILLSWTPELTLG